jgi:phosphonate transport system substrate-binding protein
VPDRARGLRYLQPEDLGGKTFAFNDPNSTSGYLVPSAFFMMEMNTDPAKLFSNDHFSGSHEASILAVANRRSTSHRRTCRTCSSSPGRTRSRAARSA